MARSAGEESKQMEERLPRRKEKSFFRETTVKSSYHVRLLQENRTFKPKRWYIFHLIAKGSLKKHLLKCNNRLNQTAWEDVRSNQRALRRLQAECDAAAWRKRRTSSVFVLKICGKIRLLTVTFIRFYWVLCFFLACFVGVSCFLGVFLQWMDGC